MKKLIIPPFFVLLSIISMLLSFIFLKQFQVLPFPINLIGIVVIFIAIVLLGKSRDLFEKNKTEHNFTLPTHLITDGIYSKTRNPMYLGMTIGLFGISLIFGNLIAMFVPLIFIIIVSFLFIPKEEKMLSEIFGNDFIEYKSKTRMWL